MLRADRVRLLLGGRPVVDDVTVELRPGEVLAVLGPNGAGKSTLLRALSGLLPPRAGAVTLDGIPLQKWRRRDLARRRAVLPQESQLAFPFRVHEVVQLGRSPHGGNGREPADLRAIDGAMAMTDTLQFADRLYGTLSGGEKQRVQMARALAQIWDDPSAGAAPRYLLMDEPTNNLDLRHQHGALWAARRLAADGVGVLAILHDINLAATFADRLCLMKRGRVVALGTTGEILTSDNLEAAFDVAVDLLPHPSSPIPHVIWTVAENPVSQIASTP
jgi:iron complex transport system ATP-binding protein